MAVGSPVAADVRKCKATLALEELMAALKDVETSDFSGPPPGFDKKFLDYSIYIYIYI